MAASEERRLQALVLAPVRRVQRRLNAVAWAEAGIAPVWAAATACVLARLLLRDAAVWVMPLLGVAGLAAWAWRARSRGVSLEHAAVLADRSSGAGGLLLTRLERPVGEWELSVNQLARAVKPPEVKWRRPVGAVLGALAFLAVGFLLPRPTFRERPVNAAAATKVAAVQAQAEALAKEEPLGQNVDEELRRLAEEVAEGRFDAADWEAADALEQRLADRAAEAAAELSRATEAARELEDALGAAGSAESAAREREALEQALVDLEGGDGDGTGAGKNGDTPPDAAEARGQEQQAQAQNGSRGQQGSQGSNSAQAQARAKAAGSPDQIADLRRSLERRRQSLEQRFGEQGSTAREAQARARRESGRRSESGQRGERGEGQGEQGEEGSDEAGESGSRGQSHASRGVRKGSGADRGGESQPVVFGGEAEMDPERLAFEPLPPGQGGEAQELWGLKAADPQARTGPAGGGGARGTGARGDATAGPGAAPLLPRNRELVKRYFGGE